MKISEQLNGNSAIHKSFGHSHSDSNVNGIRVIQSTQNPQSNHRQDLFYYHFSIEPLIFSMWTMSTVSIMAKKAIKGKQCDDK